MISIFKLLRVVNSSYAEDEAREWKREALKIIASMTKAERQTENQSKKLTARHEQEIERLHRAQFLYEEEMDKIEVKLIKRTEEV